MLVSPSHARRSCVDPVIRELRRGAAAEPGKGKAWRDENRLDQIRHGKSRKAVDFEKCIAFGNGDSMLYAQARGNYKLRVGVTLRMVQIAAFAVGSIVTWRLFRLHAIAFYARRASQSEQQAQTSSFTFSCAARTLAGLIHLQACVCGRKCSRAQACLTKGPDMQTKRIVPSLVLSIGCGIAIQIRLSRKNIAEPWNSGWPARPMSGAFAAIRCRT